MHPAKISEKEDRFAATMKLPSGRTFKHVGTVTIPGGFEITSIRPADPTYYYPADTTKKSICLHFTVGYIMSDIEALSKPGNHVSVSYVVDRAGRIYELFPDNNWSYHLGSGTIGGNTALSKQSIGIEISNYGPLTMKNGKLYDAYGSVYCTAKETEFYEEHEYRGNKHYALMSPIQVAATASLVKYLATKHSINLDFVKDDEPFDDASTALNFNGVFFHSNVRKDKFDWPLSLSMKSIVDACTEQPKETPKDTPAKPEEEPARCEDPAKKVTPKATTKKAANPKASSRNPLDSIREAITGFLQILHLR